MKTSLLIICGIGLGWVGTWLLHDIFLIVWKQGYDAGRKAEVESWAKLANQADEAVKEIGRTNRG